MNNIGVFALYLVVMLDVSGQGILFPALNTLIIDPANGFLPSETSTSTRNFYYGLIIGSFFFCWFLGATMIASISDEIGRKKSLIICLIGSAFGYGLTIIGIYAESVTLLVVGRVVAGFTAGSQSVSQAAIIDISTEETRTQNLGRIVAATAGGLALGPIIGGIFSDKSLWSELNVAVPVYIITGLILLTLIIVALYFEDVREVKGKFSLNVFLAFSELGAAIKYKPIRNISIVFFLCVFATTLFYIYSIVYLFKKFEFTTLENSVAMLVMGLAMAAASRFLIKPLQERFSQSKTVSAALVLMVVFQALFLMSGNDIFAVICIFPMLMAYGVAYTNCLDIFSASVPEHRQGWAMGISISLLTLGGGISSIFGEEMMNLLLQLPFLVSILCLAIAAILAIVLKILNPYMEKEGTAKA